MPKKKKSKADAEAFEGTELTPVKRIKPKKKKAIQRRKYSINRAQNKMLKDIE